MLLETSYGDIVVDLLPESAPNACLNFVKLCRIKYYNDCEFFHIEKGFIAQTGDPTNTGNGGASVFAKCAPQGTKYFKPERAAGAKHSRKGTVSMIASEAAVIEGKKGHGSQFFVTLADGLNYLDGIHTVFGYVAEGMEVVDKIANTFVDDKFQPFRLIRIRHTIVLHDPFDDPKGLPKDCRSPEPAQGGRGDRLGSDDEEEVNQAEVGGEAKGRVKEAEEEREAKSRAEVLEMVGDIASADMKPPENVLFVCKLNPVTEAEDLEIIFSRFGECKADIPRDRTTGESLCYGFIEFEGKSQCEKAFFKMEGALIDDRAIHVDFSQSVSKLWKDTRLAHTRLAQSQQQGIARSLATHKRPRAANAPVLLPGQGVHSGQNHEVTPTRGPHPTAMNSGAALNSETVQPFTAKRPRRSRFDVRPTRTDETADPMR